MWQKIRKWWLFRVSNPTERTGESGAFRWRFRRYFLEIRTLSDNFRMRFTAAQNPYGYLYFGEDSQTEGFSERMYAIGMLLTTDQQFVNDIDKAIEEYEKRKAEQWPTAEDLKEDEIAMEQVRELNEHMALPEEERKRKEKESEKKLRKVEKKLKNG